MSKGFVVLAIFWTGLTWAEQVRIRVVNSITGSAIVGADVSLLSESTDQLSGQTGVGGTFEGQTRSGGRFMLMVTRRGYRMTGGGMMGRIVEIKDGAEIKVEMAPLAILTGRILDQYGDPLRRAIVRTEDKLNTPHDGEDLERFAPVHSRYQWPRVGGVLIYPNASRIEDAQPAEAVAGIATRLNDIYLTIVRAVTVSGQIHPPPPPKSFINLERTDHLALHSSPVFAHGFVGVDGSFKMEALPGTYTLTARDSNGKMSKPQTIELRGNIDNLEVELTTAYHISGRFAIDGAEPLDYSKVQLNFLGPQVKVGADGAFEADLGDSRAGYLLQGLPKGWYVKEVVVAGKRIAGRRFQAEPGSTNVLFMLSPRGARVEITVTGSSPLDAAMVVLLPERDAPPDDPESMLIAEPETTGHLVVNGVPPGSYRLFTLDATDWPLLYRPDQLLEKHRDLAPLIRVAEGETKSVVAPVVKIPPE